MKNILILLLLLFISPASYSQGIFGFAPKKEKKPEIFKGEREKINDLIHTELKVQFNLAQHTMDGEARIKLKPHFYPTDSLTLDAKYMKINEVKVDGQKVDYTYDKLKLKIKLPRTYTRFNSYEVSIKYVAQPDSVKTPGGNAIKSNKGLYFINTRGENDAYPPQIWTQGEPEAASAWFPTIDSPNQKSTEKIEMTVPAEWVTLSNGKLIQSIEHTDSTRTDVWEMNQPHAPYLFFMFTGPFVIVKDSLGNLPVWYYVEKPYEDVAKDIFGKTPEMIRYYSNLLDYEYPWNKYHQVVGREFVSGAMENTTAVLHSDMAYQDKSSLVDENTWEGVIAHELFHQWFGDLVTAESWAQIAMNESFASYGEALWEEHDEGKDKADYILDKNRRVYMMIPGNDKKKLVRYHYSDPDDVFDAVSYQKGSLILHMLRNLVGDNAFFSALKLYLTQNKYGTGEAAQLRLAMEKVSGKDLTEFFNQWFYGSGHPSFDIEYEFSDSLKEARVRLTQKTKKTWKFPLKIDVYEGEKRTSHEVFVDDSTEVFHFNYNRKPDFINVNADHVLLANIKDPRPDETYYFQFTHARNYIDRKMGLDKAIKNKKDIKAFRIIELATEDPFYIIRIRAINALDIESPFFNKKLEKKLYRIARTDPNNLVKAAAIRKLGMLKKKKYVSLFKKSIHSPSRAIKSAAFDALLLTDKASVYKILTPELEKELRSSLIKLYVEDKKTEKMNFVAKNLFVDLGEFFSPENRKTIEEATKWISTSNNLEANKILADEIYRFGKKYKQYGLNRFAIMMLTSYKKNQSENKGNHKDEIIKYYEETIAKLKKI